jgi:hypothetical protein
MRILLLDNGKNFLLKVILYLLGLLRIRYRLTTPYYLRANSKVKNLNSTFREILIKIYIGKLVTT